jgi:hypothetical protein
MNVRAKFWVKEITNHHTNSPDAVSATVKLAPVYDDGTKQNADWSKYTPQGEISMMITNPAAVAAFSLGAKYFVDFTPTE